MVRVEHPTVLVADDDQGNRGAVQEALETVGYRTLPAETGRDAVQVIQQHEIHLGVFDIFMPEMTGFDAIRFLRDQHIYLPVILMTSDRSQDIHERARHAGAISLILKPIDLAVIRKAVEQAFDRFV